MAGIRVRLQFPDESGVQRKFWFLIKTEPKTIIADVAADISRRFDRKCCRLELQDAELTFDESVAILRDEDLLRVEWKPSVSETEGPADGSKKPKKKRRKREADPVDQVICDDSGTSNIPISSSINSPVNTKSSKQSNGNHQEETSVTKASKSKPKHVNSLSTGSNDLEERASKSYEKERSPLPAEAEPQPVMEHPKKKGKRKEEATLSVEPVGSSERPEPLPVEDPPAQQELLPVDTEEVRATRKRRRKRKSQHCKSPEPQPLAAPPPPQHFFAAAHTEKPRQHIRFDAIPPEEPRPFLKKSTAVPNSLTDTDRMQSHDHRLANSQSNAASYTKHTPSKPPVEVASRRTPVSPALNALLGLRSAVFSHKSPVAAAVHAPSSAPSRAAESFVTNQQQPAEEPISVNTGPAPANSETAMTSADPSTWPLLTGRPRVGDIIAYKVLEMSENYTPEVSDFRQGRVIEALPSGQLTIEIVGSPVMKRCAGGKFELTDPDADEAEEEAIEDVEVETLFTHHWNELIDARLA